MFTNASFTVAFEDAKKTVNELRVVLRDLLDLEQQNRQDQLLKDGLDITLEISSKIDRLLLFTLEIENKMEEAAKGKVHEFVGTVAEQIFNKFRALTGQKISGENSQSTISFKKFKTAYELEYNDGVQISKKQERGLKHALDADNDGDINLAEWICFFKRFEKSGMGMDSYMLKLCDEAPDTNYEIARRHSAAAGSMAKDIGSSMGSSMGKVGGSLGSSMGKMGGSMLSYGKKKVSPKPVGKTAEELKKIREWD